MYLSDVYLGGSLRRALWSLTALWSIGCGSSGSGDSCATALCVTAGETVTDPSGGSQPTGASDPTNATDPTGVPTGDGPPTCEDCGADQVCIQGTCTDVPNMCPCPVETYCDLGAGKCVIGCTKDAECDEGRICDVDKRECRPGCREDGECAAGEVCDATVCRPGCNSDADCPLEQLCDMEARACEAGCKTVANCAPGKLCEAGQCQFECVDDAGCGAGELCKYNVCVVGCAGDAECGPGELCINEKCMVGCKADSACDLGEVCLGGQCTAGCGPPGGAKTDARDDRCPVGKACTGVGCQGDTNCADFICSDVCEGSCHETASEPYECFAGVADDTSYCMPKCDTSADCPQGMGCFYHKADVLYLLCRTICASDADCKDMIVSGYDSDCYCNAGACRETFFDPNAWECNYTAAENK